MDKPYMETRLYSASDGTIRVDVDFNKTFVVLIDKFYSSRDKNWRLDKDDNGKVAIYLADMMMGVAQPHFPADAEPETDEDEILGDLANIPLLGQGEPVRQIADIARAGRIGGDHEDIRDGYNNGTLRMVRG